MTMRKYIVTIHDDGSVSALEFEEPADHAQTNYRTGFRDAVYEILDSLDRLKLSYIDKTREHIQCGRMGDAHDEECKSLALYIAVPN